jgi:hypothetical protein
LFPEFYEQLKEKFNSSGLACYSCHDRYLMMLLNLLNVISGFCQNTSKRVSDGRRKREKKKEEEEMKEK